MTGHSAETGRLTDIKKSSQVAASLLQDSFLCKHSGHIGKGDGSRRHIEPAAEITAQRFGQVKEGSIVGGGRQFFEFLLEKRKSFFCLQGGRIFLPQIPEERAHKADEKKQRRQQEHHKPCPGDRPIFINRRLRQERVAVFVIVGDSLFLDTQFAAAPPSASWAVTILVALTFRGIGSELAVA